ncbi:hypothetical protein N9043_00695 [bacterium]|nr:hypothetical protein [bacterium]
MTQVLAKVEGECSKWIDLSCLDKTVTYTFEQSSVEGVTEINIVGTENPSGTEVSNITLTIGNEGHDTVELNTNTGVVTFTEVSDIDGTENVTTIDLNSWLENKVIGEGATTITWDGDKFVVSSEDRYSSVTDNGDNTYTYQQLDTDGNPVGNPVTIVDRDTTNTTFELNTTDSKMLELTDSNGNTLSVDLTQAVCAILNNMEEVTCP